MSSTESSPRRLLVWIVLAIAIVWPPVFSLVVQPRLVPRIDPNQASIDDVQRLLNVQRFTLHVPPECDGWFLSLVSVVDGVEKTDGGGSVPGGSDLVVLVRRAQDTKQIEYCWSAPGRVFRGVIDDPLVEVGALVYREGGVVKSGDWLMAGNHGEVTGGPDLHGDFGVRIVLRNSQDDTGA